MGSRSKINGPGIFQECITFLGFSVDSSLTVSSVTGSSLTSFLAFSRLKLIYQNLEKGGKLIKSPIQQNGYF